MARNAPGFLTLIHRLRQRERLRTRAFSSWVVIMRKILNNCDKQSGLLSELSPCQACGPLLLTTQTHTTHLHLLDSRDFPFIHNSRHSTLKKVSDMYAHVIYNLCALWKCSRANFVHWHAHAKHYECIACDPQQLNHVHMANVHFHCSAHRRLAASHGRDCNGNVIRVYTFKWR